MAFLLKTDDHVYYSLQSPQVVTADKTRATLFDTLEEAHYWNDHHSLMFHKLADLGFKVFERKSKGD